MPGLVLSYRKAHPEDIAFLLKLRRETMEAHLQQAGYHLSEEEHLKRIHYQFDAIQIVLIKEEAIGMLKVRLNANSYEIIQIQISPKFQNKGIGRKLIDTIIESAKAKKLSVTLSVLKQNKALGLYQKLGFKIISTTSDSYNLSLK